VAAITASKVSGMPPLRSNLDASGSSDPDGEIVSYEFDWEGDGTWDVHSGSPVQWHDFPRGTFQTAVRVTDDLGARDTASIEINTDLPPEADLWCLYTTGEAPLAVTFDMSRSKGGAGYLVSYEYDWESDGTIDLVTEKNNYIHRVFETPGTYEVSATVINDTGLTDTTSTTITVYPGNGAPNWHYLTVCGGYYPETELIDGKPAMAYLDVDDGVHCAKYITALDGRGFSWAEPVVIGESVSTYPWHEIKVELISVGGLPTACFPQANESTGHIELVFSQAMDVTGQSWSPPVVVAAEADDDLFAYALAEINGRPAVAYCFYDDIGLYYRTATGADGTEWELPVMANQQNQSRAEELSLALVDGRPAIAWVDPALLYAIAADPLGETWPHVYQYSTWNPYLHVDMCVVDGHPAIAFYECGNIVGPGKDLWYRRAEDPAGGSWAAPVRLTDSSDELDSGRYLSMAVVAGKPAVTCWESLPGDVISFVAATDGVGTAWDPPELISQWYDYGERSSLMETAEGYPGIAMDQYGICWAVKF